MATLTITDRGDGTGADATIAGSAGTNNLYVARFAGTLASSAFTLAGTRSGDGTIAIPQSTGPFFAALESGGSWLAPQGFRVTDGTEGIHSKSLSAVRDFIRSLSLPLIPSDESKHRLHKRPIRTMKEFGQKPNGCHYWVGKETAQRVDNTRLRITYPVIWFFVSGHEGENAFDGDWTYIRQKITQGFGACPLPEVPEIHSVEVDYLDIFLPVGESLPVDLQGLTFRCITEQPSLLD